MKKPTILNVIESLILQIPIKLPIHSDTDYTEITMDDDGNICTKMEGSEGDFWMVTNYTLKELVRAAEKLTFDESFIISAQIVLNKEARDKRRGVM
jgi:hypothetical protein